MFYIIRIIVKINKQFNINVRYYSSQSKVVFKIDKKSLGATTNFLTPKLFDQGAVEIRKIRWNLIILWIEWNNTCKKDLLFFDFTK